MLITEHQAKRRTREEKRPPTIEEAQSNFLSLPLQVVAQNAI